MMTGTSKNVIIKAIDFYNQQLKELIKEIGAEKSNSEDLKLVKQEIVQLNHAKATQNSPNL